MSTPNLGLNLPDYSLPLWNVPVNQNWNILDTAVGLLTASAATTLGSTVIGFGDSLIGGSSTDTTIGPNFFNVMVMLSQGQMQVLHNGGVTGNTTTQMLARIASEVLALPASKVVIDGGTNDIGLGVPMATIQANLLTMYRQIVGNRQTPILCTIPPRLSANYLEISELNAWIRKQSAVLNVPLIDLFAICVDPATGDYKAGFSPDGIHPISVGALRIVGQAALTSIASVFPSHRPLLPYFNTDPTNLMANGLLLASTSGIANGWAASAASGHVTYTVATDSSMTGNCQVITKSASATSDGDALSGPDITTGYNPGDKLCCVGRLATSGLESGISTVQPTLNIYFYTAGFAGIAGPYVTPWSFWNCDIAAGQWYMEFIVPPATAHMQYQLNIGNGKGIIKFGQIGMFNLTALGLA